MIGRWYDPIAGRWHEPKPPLLLRESCAYETEEAKGRRLAYEQSVWNALTATAEASRQASAEE